VWSFATAEQDEQKKKLSSQLWDVVLCKTFATAERAEQKKKLTSQLPFVGWVWDVVL
jgi:ssRNA-specific RNase YbeY (16S rRNA maturation enzyme)